MNERGAPLSLPMKAIGGENQEEIAIAKFASIVSNVDEIFDSPVF